MAFEIINLTYLLTYIYCEILTLTERKVAVNTNDELTTFVTPDGSVDVHSDKLVTCITDVCEPRESTSTQLTQFYLLHDIILVVITSATSAASTTTA